MDPRSAVIFATLVGLILTLSAIVANAQYAPTFPSERCYGCWVKDRYGEYHYVNRRSDRRWRADRRQEVRGWHSHGGGYYPSEERCKGFLAVVGDQYATEEGAREESRKAWRQTARWQLGERWMVVENADDVSFECGRSSVGSVVGQVFYRCRLTARPCRAEPKREDR